ncbi:MAG: hypothetical protein JNK65_08955, partial [Deltaproteobacteria bacterium]|nr:hypothetical protein [Deltaproteobacteria bacterium]
MSTPINNSKGPNTNYDDYEYPSNDVQDRESDDYSNEGVGDNTEDSYVDDGGEGRTVGGSSYSVDEALKHLTDRKFQDSIRQDKSLTPEQKKEIFTKINKAIAELKSLHSKHITEMSPDVSQLVGDIEATMAPPEAAGGDGVGGSGEGGDSSDVKSQLTQLKDSIKANKDLSADQKKSFNERIDKLSSGLELKSIDEEKIQSEIDQIKGDVEKAVLYPPGFDKLSSVTGKSVEELQELFKKHNLDPKKLPNPPDAAVASLLNDPEFSQELTSAKEGLVTSYKDLKTEQDKVAAECKARNDDAKAHTSTNNSTFAPFEKAEALFEHKSDADKTYLTSRKKVADETAKLLGAMYPNVQVGSTNPDGSVDMSTVGSAGDDPGGYSTGHGIVGG